MNVSLPLPTLGRGEMLLSPFLFLSVLPFLNLKKKKEKKKNLIRIGNLTSKSESFSPS
jgi:hypothetical protein